MNLLLLLISVLFIALLIYGAYLLHKKLGADIKVIVDVFFYARVSTVVMLLGGILLLLNDQGKDLAVGLADNYLRGFGFLLAVGLWALQSWYCARRILDLIYADKRGENKWQDRIVSAVPRLLGLLAFAVAVVALCKAADSTAGYVYVAIAIAMAIAFILLVIYRRNLQKHASRYVALDFEKLLFRIIHAISVSIIVIFTTWAFLSPVSMGFTLGAGTIAFIVMASLVPIGTTMVYFTLKPQFPVVLSLFFVAVIFSGYNDNHAIRSLEQVAQRTSAEQALSRWQQHNPGDQRQLIVVATAGGGIRAAYWTATVLGAIQDQEPAFRDKLFAISGVSGGTVGASVFTTLLVDQADKCHDKAICYAELGQAVLAGDFLGPTVASMLYPDFAQRLLPVAILPDRAQALETSWETNWRKALRSPDNPLGAGFTQLWSNNSERWLPLLLSNSTHEETGNRIITSPMQISQHIFPDTSDFFDISPCEIPISTAAHNSARFTYISPAGRISAGDCEATANNPGLQQTHLVDGGYFENYGAATAHDLLKWVATQETANIQPIVIQISNDVNIPENLLDDDYVTQAEPVNFMNETRAPINTIFKTRGARGIMELVNLYRWTQKTKDGCFFHFRFYKDAEHEPALGWVLSQKSQKWIRDHLRNQNGETYNRLIKTLETGDCH